jgi:diguanylate cyclase (GGDEF)-like protein/PAS domain S-box-containing protein
MQFSRLSIKHQLLIVVFVIALPAVGIIINSGIEQRRTAMRNAQIETQKLADAIANEQNNIINSTRQLFIVLSQLPEVYAHDAIKVQTLLTQIHQLSPQYVGIFIADASGTVWASSAPSSKNRSISGMRYFENALVSGKLSSGEYAFGRATKKATLSFGYPIRGNDGKISHVVCASIALDYYRHIINAYHLPAGASYALIDHAGIVLTRAVDAEKYRGKPSNAEIFKQMLAGPEQETSFGISSVLGDHRVQTYRKLSLEGETTPYMYIRAGIPTASVIKHANTILTQNMTIYTAFLLLAFFLSWMIGKRYIIDRVHALKRSSQLLAAGDLSVRISTSVTGGELGSLGQALDNMAQRLSDHIQEIKQISEEYQTIIRTTSDGFNICDINGRILEANSAYCSMIGYARDELLQMNIADMEANEDPEMVAAHINRIITSGSDSFISRQRHKNGLVIDVEITVTYLNELGGRLYSFVRDITDRKRMEGELQRAATYDHLTGVFNRLALEDKIIYELERTRRNESSFSLIMLDIDNFKIINDTLGHQMGDKVICNIAALLQNQVRSIDSVGRWGGEEFVVLLTDTFDREAALVAEKLRNALDNNITIHAVTVTASFGVTTYQKWDTLDTMISRADRLLYLAKSRGKNRVETVANNS